MTMLRWLREYAEESPEGNKLGLVADTLERQRAEIADLQAALADAETTRDSALKALGPKAL